MIVKAREILKDFTLCGVGCIGEEGISLFTKRSSAIKKVCIFKIKRLNLVNLDPI